jgi:hypothetical protein
MTATPCTTCARIGLNNTIFPECIRIVGMWGSCCGNCKWPDHATSCRWGGDNDSDNSNGDIGTGGRGGRSRRGGRGGSSGGGRTKQGRITQRGAVRKTPRGGRVTRSSAVA